MRNMNKINCEEPVGGTGWEELTKLNFEKPSNRKLEKVDFRDQNDIVDHVKEDINDVCIEMKSNYNAERLNAEAFMLIFLGRLHPIITGYDLCHLYDNYDFWKQALGELKPIIAGYWAECDPMIIGYLFTVFISQFLVILELWEKVSFSRFYMEDCAILGEFYIDMSALQNDILQNTIEHWGLKHH